MLKYFIFAFQTLVTDLYPCSQDFYVNKKATLLNGKCEHTLLMLLGQELLKKCLVE
jgi:hypothetical protein